MLLRFRVWHDNACRQGCCVYVLGVERDLLSVIAYPWLCFISVVQNLAENPTLLPWPLFGASVNPIRALPLGWLHAFVTSRLVFLDSTYFTF